LLFKIIFEMHPSLVVLNKFIASPSKQKHRFIAVFSGYLSEPVPAVMAQCALGELVQDQ